MSDPAAPQLTALAADDVIAAARLLRTVLDGGTFEGQLTAAGVWGLAVFTVSVMIANAELCGIAGVGAQAAEVRRWLDKSIAHATLEGLTRDAEDADG